MHEFVFVSRVARLVFVSTSREARGIFVSDRPSAGRIGPGAGRASGSAGRRGGSGRPRAGRERVGRVGRPESEHQQQHVVFQVLLPAITRRD